MVWYAQKSAFDLGEKGIRVCSLSPGLIATDMGKLEEKEGGSMLAFAAEKRMGTPDELKFCSPSYFSSEFKSVFGILPQKYREDNKSY